MAHINLEARIPMGRVVPIWAPKGAQRFLQLVTDKCPTNFSRLYLRFRV